VAGQQDRAVDLGDSAGNVGGIGREAAQRAGHGDDVDPGGCSSLMTLAHIEPSANALCTRSTVGVLPFRGGAEWLMTSVAAVDRHGRKLRRWGRALAQVTLLPSASTSDRLPHMLPVAPIRSVGVTMPMW